MIAGCHGAASGGPSHDFLVFPTCRGAARVPGRGRSCNLQDICVLPVVECWNFQRFTGSRRGRSCNLQYKGFALRLCLNRLKLPRFAGPRPGQSCNLAGICFATLLRSGWRYMIRGNSISATSKHVFGAIAAYTCIGLARARDWAFLLGVSRGICIPNAAQQQY